MGKLVILKKPFTSMTNSRKNHCLTKSQELKMQKSKSNFDLSGAPSKNKFCGKISCNQSSNPEETRR
jgi:hypothetical protein